MFGTAVATWLVSKEIYVLEHEYYTGLSILIMAVFVVKKAGPKLAEWIDKQMDAEEETWVRSRTDEIDALESCIEHEKKEQWRTDAQKLIVEAKKENILMQLEAAYRERLATVSTEVIDRISTQ